MSRAVEKLYLKAKELTKEGRSKEGGHGGLIRIFPIPQTIQTFFLSVTSLFLLPSVVKNPN